MIKTRVPIVIDFMQVQTATGKYWVLTITPVIVFNRVETNNYPFNAWCLVQKFPIVHHAKFTLPKVETKELEMQHIVATHTKHLQVV